MTWKIKEFEKPKLKNPILIEGLPGIGNVGKIAADFIVDSLKAKKIYQIYSHSFPHSVFVNEDNLVELPLIEIYYKKLKDKDLLLVAGDIQPIDETSCYEFCEKILDISEQFKTKEIITLGGIGLQDIPKEPQVYCTANNKKIMENYSKKSKTLNTNIYGVVGPVVGVSGLLVGLAKERNISAISLLAETFGHPSYLGIKSAREILKVINNVHKLNLDFEKLDKEIIGMEEEIKKLNLNKLQKSKDQQIDLQKPQQRRDITYIG